MATSLQTPSQTVGPFFHYGLVFGGENLLVRDGTRGRRIIVTGRVFDGDDAAVPDAMLEIWQADAAGIYDHPSDPRRGQADRHFTGFGRSPTNFTGNCYRFETVKPGAVPGPKGVPQAPHLAVRVFSRGLLTHLSTRCYFADEMAANNADPVFTRLDPERRTTLLARPDEAIAGAPPCYRFDLHLQGPGETLFFQP